MALGLGLWTVVDVVINDTGCTGSDVVDKEVVLFIGFTVDVFINISVVKKLAVVVFTVSLHIYNKCDSVEDIYSHGTLLVH